MNLFYEVIGRGDRRKDWGGAFERIICRWKYGEREESGLFEIQRNF